MRETWRNRVPPAAEDVDEDGIEWRADWGRSCDVCGQTPCVVGTCRGVVVVEPSRCADCIDTEMARVDIGSGY